MTCHSVKLPSGAHAIVCTLPSVERCTVCGHPAGKLCDYLVGKNTTCDAALCNRHAVSRWPGIDWCPTHPGIQRR